jgi:hypothetical protein
MNNSRNFIFILFFIVNGINAQIVLRGYVKDSINEPLEFVNIFTQENDSSSIIAFGTSDNKGYFSFETPTLSQFVVKASALGYATKAIDIRNNNKTVLEVNFILSSKEYILKETVVRGSNKVLLRSDTITFNADKYRDSTERNLEELLAKIPGLDVDKNTGIISVQGQPIKKILIDGDDLTGRNYQLMSQNMSADVVDKIQVIDKFTENKLLKGLKRSDDKVINITLKEGRKKLLFGNALVGVGNDGRTNNSFNLFGFFNKLKTISFGNFNTIGQLSTADRLIDMDFKEDTESENQRSLLKSYNTSLIDIGRTPSVSLNSQSVRFNRALFGSTHFTIRPTESLSLKGAMTYTYDRVRSFINNQFNYIFRDSSFKLNEQNDIERNPTVLEGHLEAQLDLSSKSLLRYKGDFRKSFASNTAQTIANTNAINNTLTTQSLSFANACDFTHRINNYQAVTANLTIINQDNTQSLSIAQNQSRITPSVFLRADAFSQKLEKPLQYYTLNGQWLYSKNSMKLSIYMGIVFRKENFVTSLNGQFQNNFVVLSDTFQNDQPYNQKNYYLGLNLKEEWLGFQWFSDISGGYHQSSITSRIDKSEFYVLPTLGFKRKIKEKHAFFGTYAYNYALPQAADLSSGYVLTDYRNLERGSQFFIPANSHTGIFNYTYGNFSDEFLAHLNILHTSNSNGYRANININNDFNVSDKVENTFVNRNTIISASIERYIPKIYVRLKIRPTLIIGNYPNTLNESDIRNTNTENRQLDISLRSAYLSWFNFHIGTTFNQSIIKTDIGNTNNEVRNYSIGSFCDFYLRFNDRFNAKIENEIFYFKQQTSTIQKYYFINSSANYDVIKTKLMISLAAKNLVNTNEFINSFVTDYSTQINKIQLLPRYILLEVNFRF